MEAFFCVFYGYLGAVKIAKSGRRRVTSYAAGSGPNARRVTTGSVCSCCHSYRNTVVILQERFKAQLSKGEMTMKEVMIGPYVNNDRGSKTKELYKFQQQEVIIVGVEC